MAICFQERIEVPAVLDRDLPQRVAFAYHVGIRPLGHIVIEHWPGVKHDLGLAIDRIEDELERLGHFRIAACHLVRRNVLGLQPLPHQVHALADLLEVRHARHGFHPLRGRLSNTGIRRIGEPPHLVQQRHAGTHAIEAVTTGITDALPERFDGGGSLGLADQFHGGVEGPVGEGKGVPVKYVLVKPHCFLIIDIPP